MTKAAFDKIKEQIKQQISILDIADEYGLTIVPKSRGTFSLVEHDSVLIYPKTNSFYRYSTDVGGDVMKFMEEIPEINIPFTKAFKMLSSRIDNNKEIESVNTGNKEVKDKFNTYKDSLLEKQKRAMRLNKQFKFDNNCKNAMAYLIQTRKIDADIVKKLVFENCIKQETMVLYKNKNTGKIVTNKTNDKNMNSYNKIENKSVVFIGHDEYGMVATACKRACNTRSSFKGEYSGTDYSYGWLCDPEVNPCNAYLPSQSYKSNKRLVCFESYIDMLSFMTILKQQGTDFTKYAYLSCGSATKYATALSVQERIGYKDVTICFDNDEAGKKFTKLLKEKLERKGVNVKTLVSKEKDWNNELIVRKMNKNRGINGEKAKAIENQKNKLPVKNVPITKKELCR